MEKEKPKKVVFDDLFQSFFTNNQTNNIEEKVIVEEKEAIKEKETIEEKKTVIIPRDKAIFDISTFISELRENDAKKTKEYSLKNTNMSAYDVASECIAKVVMKILNYPIEDYSSNWLPVLLRGYIGNSIHDFIQSETNQFTETERSLRVPSIHFSGRFDGVIGNSTLVEIKSCTYDDYKKIIKTHQPRLNDFYQLIVYKYVLENYLDEIQNQPVKSLRSKPPEQKEYDIDKFQFIYVCHQIFAADYNSIQEAIQDVKYIKKLLNSKHNQFYFICSLIIDLTKLDIDMYLDPIKRKIERINHYVSLNQLPDKDDEFIDTKKCFFCSYNSKCKYRL